MLMLWAAIITIIVLRFLHMHLFVLIFDKLKNRPRPTFLFKGESVLNGLLYKAASCVIPESGHL